MMFAFTIRYLGFLKFVPGLAYLFDAWLKVWTFATQPLLLDWIDNITDNAAQWPGVGITLHKYGGTQFNCRGKEIGHIHGNGLLDMLVGKKVKEMLTVHGQVLEHHYFKNTGWISFYIRTEADSVYALTLLKIGYERINNL